MLHEPKLPLNDCNFIGRDREIEEIVNHLESKSTRIVSVYGPPAFGKTEVVITVGQKLKSKGRTVYHVDLCGVDTEDGVISAILCFFKTKGSGNGTLKAR